MCRELSYWWALSERHPLIHTPCNPYTSLPVLVQGTRGFTQPHHPLQATMTRRTPPRCATSEAMSNNLIRTSPLAYISYDLEKVLATVAEPKAFPSSCPLIIAFLHHYPALEQSISSGTAWHFVVILSFTVISFVVVVIIKKDSGSVFFLGQRGWLKPLDFLLSPPLLNVHGLD